MKILFIFIFLLRTVTAYSQPSVSKAIEVREFESQELEINDCLFVTNLDSLIWGTSCPNLNDKTYKYFTIYFNDKETMYVELQEEPFGERSYGYFKLRDYLFFVNGEIPNNLFKKSNKKQLFSYVYEEFPATGRSPLWVILYINGQLKLIEKDCW